MMGIYRRQVQILRLFPDLKRYMERQRLNTWKQLSAGEEAMANADKHKRKSYKRK